MKVSLHVMSFECIWLGWVRQVVILYFPLCLGFDNVGYCILHAIIPYISGNAKKELAIETYY